MSVRLSSFYVKCNKCTRNRENHVTETFSFTLCNKVQPCFTYLFVPTDTLVETSSYLRKTFVVA